MKKLIFVAFSALAFLGASFAAGAAASAVSYYDEKTDRVCKVNTLEKDGETIKTRSCQPYTPKVG